MNDKNQAQKSAFTEELSQQDQEFVIIIILIHYNRSYIKENMNIDSLIEMVGLLSRLFTFNENNNKAVKIPFRQFDKLDNKLQKVVIEVKDGSIKKEINIFDIIYGHDELKLIFYNAINEESSPVHIMLTGARGTAKSLFLQAIKDNLSNVHYITNNSSGAGIMNYLSKHPNTRILCIDEFEKIPHNEANVLLDIMESQKLRSEKAVNNKQYDLDMDLRIFATSNNIKKLTPEMKSRFLIFHLKEYSYEQFVQVSKNLFEKKFPKKMHVSDTLIDAVWNKMKSNDVRDIIKLARLCRADSDIDKVIRALQKYSPEDVYEENE
jgi:hypothetical protein